LEIGLDLPMEDLLHHPCTISLYQGLVNTANCHLPYWGTVKRFQLINTDQALKKGTFALDGSCDRTKIMEIFAGEIANLYREEKTKKHLGKSKPTTQTQTNSEHACPILNPSSCPTFAQSLNPRLTGSQ
jgi:long-chain acyl-CoA synthetase